MTRALLGGKVTIHCLQRVPNRFGRMWDLAFFRLDIRDLSSKLEWKVEIKITCGSGISCFHGVGIRYSQREQSGIWDFDPSFRLLLKPWSSHCHFFLALCFWVKHGRLSERGLPPKLTCQKLQCGRIEPFVRIAVRAGMPSLGKKNVLSPNFKERDDAKSFEINCHVCLPAIISDLSFADTWTKENKTVN